MKSPQAKLTETIENFPDHYHDTFSKEFMKLLAALRLHDFSVQRADEATPVVSPSVDLWPELSHPSVWIRASTAPIKELRIAEPGTLDHARHMNEVIRANLGDQVRLLDLLEEFYTAYASLSFSTRLIVETDELGGSCLRPQGASIRILLDNKTQSQQNEAFQKELEAFTDFLIRKL